MGHHNSEGDDSEDGRSKHKRKRHKSSSRKHHDDDRKSRKRERRSRSYSESSSSSDSRRKDRKRRKKEKKQRKKAERRERKQSKKARRKEKSKNNVDDDAEVVNSRLERNYTFTNALQSLLEIQPGMASELPILLIRMAEGTSFNLSQMPDARVSTRLQQVLASLSNFGVERDDTGSWSWTAPTGGKKDPLILLKIARSLLDQIGITMEAVQDYETAAQSAREETQAQEATTALNQQTVALLQKFQKESSAAEGPTLAQELATLCNMILNGESISLDGLPDEALRQGIENLFRAAGLEKSEIEDSDDDSDDGDDDEPVMGYGLPDDNGGTASANMASILETCKTTATTTTTTKRVVKGPMLPSQGFDVHGVDGDEDEEDDEEGPAPIGSETAKRRVQRGPSLPPEVVKAMAEKRRREMAELTGVGIEADANSGEREKWMLEPGEHDLLQGIKTGNAIKSRTFENKKKRPSATQAAAAPVDPSVQAEVDAIMEMQREARGPSLMEQHRLKRAEEKAEAAKEGKADWKWSRDKDLDAGRRVDKNALNMVMGGAAGNLKDKFQGGLSRGFM
jgi:hypothetical protein